MLSEQLFQSLRQYKDEFYADEFAERIMKKAEDLLFKKRIFNDEIMEAMENGYFEFEYSPNTWSPEIHRNLPSGVKAFF